MLDHPAVHSRHAVVLFGHLDELGGRHGLALFIQHAEQYLVVGQALVAANRGDLLTAQGQVVVVQSAIDAGDPDHDLIQGLELTVAGAHHEHVLVAFLLGQTGGGLDRAQALHGLIAAAGDTGDGQGTGNDKAVLFVMKARFLNHRLELAGAGVALGFHFFVQQQGKLVSPEPANQRARGQEVGKSP